MVNLYGLLVKSTSPDVFHLETGLEDPPLQFPPPPPPPLYPLPCLFPLLPDGSSQRRWDADCVVFRSLMSLTLGNCCLLRFFSSFILLSYSNVLLQTLHSWTRHTSWCLWVFQRQKHQCDHSESYCLIADPGFNAAPLLSQMVAV